MLVVPLHRRLHADMADAGDDHVGVRVLDLMEDRREIGGIGIEADVVEHLEAGFRQAFEVALVERLGPGRVLAHDHGGLHVQGFDQEIVGVVADRLGEVRGSEIAVEGVFEMVVVVVDMLGDLVAGRAGGDERHVQPRRPRLDRQHDLADIAADDRDHLVLAHGALEGAHRVGRGGMIVVGDDLDLAAVDPAMGVDVVGGKRGRLGQRGAGDRGFLADDADSDRLGVCRDRGQGREDRQRHKGAADDEPPRGPVMGDVHSPTSQILDRSPAPGRRCPECHRVAPTYRSRCGSVNVAKGAFVAEAELTEAAVLSQTPARRMMWREYPVPGASSDGLWSCTSPRLS